MRLAVVSIHDEAVEGPQPRLESIVDRLPTTRGLSSPIPTPADEEWPLAAER